MAKVHVLRMCFSGVAARNDDALQDFAEAFMAFLRWIQLGEIQD